MSQNKIKGFCGEVKVKERNFTYSLYLLFIGFGTKRSSTYYDWNKGWMVILDEMSDLKNHPKAIVHSKGDYAVMRMIDIYNIRLEEGKS